MDLAFGNLATPLQQFGAAVHNGNLACQEQQSSAAARHGNPTMPVQWPSTATNQGNLGHREQLPSAAAIYANLGHYKQLPSTAIDASDVNHAGNPEARLGAGGALSTNHSNISFVSFMHSSCSAYLPISSSSTSFRNADNASVGIRPGQDDFANVSTPSLGLDEISGNQFDLQTNLRFGTNDISVPVETSCSFEAPADSSQQSSYVKMTAHTSSASVTTSPTYSPPTVSVSRSHVHAPSTFVPYGPASCAPGHGNTAVIACRQCGLSGTAHMHEHYICQPQRSAQVHSTLSWSAPQVSAPYNVRPLPPHRSVRRPSPSRASTPRRTLLHVEPLKLDKFSGDIAEWPGFWKQFDVAVDSQEYSDIEKINLLYQCLLGEAKSRVTGIPRSEENYALVKHLLRDAYDRPDRLLRNLMERLEEMRIPQNTPSDLKTFYMELEAICRQLEAMGHDVDNLSTRLIIQKRLPRKLLQQWMETYGVDEWIWTSIFLRDKLRHQVEVYESLGDYHQASEYSTQVYDDAPQRFTTSDGVTYVIEESSTKMEKSENRQKPPKRPATVRRKLKCPFCSHDHRAAKCDIYSSLQQRLRRADAKGLCTRCLRGKHSANKCSAKIGPCRECSGRHHVSLCDRLLSKPATSPSGQVSSQPNKVESVIRRAALPVAGNERDYDSDDFWKDNYLESEVDCPCSEDELGPIDQKLEDAAVTAHNEPATIAVQKMHNVHSCLLAVASGRVSKPTASGRSESVYILLDSCSSTTYISKKMATKLKLKQAPSRKYNVSTFGSAKPNAMIASDAIFDLHLTDRRRLNISAEVVPHIVGHTAMYDASDTDLDNLRRMQSQHLPTKPVQPDILIGTKHLYNVGFMPTNQRLRSGFTVVNTNLGQVITGHGNMITNLKPVDSCNLAIQDLSEEKNGVS